MPTAADIENLLEEVSRETEEKNRAEKARQEEEARREDHRRADRGRDREHNRNQTRNRDRYDRDRDRHRDRYREFNEDKDRARDDRGGGDHYSGSSRMRSRSPHRDRGRDYDERRGGRYRERSRDYRRPTPTPEATEDDRDRRTVFVQQIAARAEQRHLRTFFEQVGAVIDAQIVKDRVTHRSKGVGYVEFKSEEAVPKAIELTGQKLKGVPIIVQLTEAEKNRASRAAAASEGGAANNNGAPFHRLFIGNIHFSVTEEDLKEIFSPFGAIEQITLQRDDKIATRSKGYGFVQFVDPKDAKEALRDMNQFELAGRPIRVGLGNDKFTAESTKHLLDNFPAQVAKYQGSAFSGAGGRGAYAGGSGGAYDRTNGRDERGINGASALDDTDMSGVNFKQVDRNKLMANLARNEVDVPVPQSMPSFPRARASIVELPKAGRCIKIENAFDPEQELKDYGADWVKLLEKEIKDECDKKYGKVVHLAADPNSEGDVYVKFDSVTGGEKALQGLNGRNYNHRVIRASYVVDKIYDSLYASAAKN
ncbi:splicing factor, CC1-like protein [Periconia macrospinosa]|uniref:Splicing factor, CC1-like protein n=1 Tax=Periconia macrospinosa TaxID=97972 RepID=A0A2V1DNZ8_9PLEO|nr:splicing factor, CC1-like protein [Periconia macrospinosa]